MKKIVAFMFIALLPAVTAFAQNNKVFFDNQSGELALVKLIGPTTKEVEVPTGMKVGTDASAGKYIIKVRYGTQGKYSYSKGDEFEVKETATKRSEITITLHKIVAGNYDAEPISEKEFNQPIDTSRPTADQRKQTSLSASSAAEIKSFDGFYSPGMHRMDKKEFALFLDPSRSVNSLKPWNKEEELLKAVAHNSADLLVGSAVFRAFNKGRIIEGKNVDDMLVIGLYPGVGIPSTGDIRDPVTFTAGTLKTLDEVNRIYGKPTEKEVWMGKSIEDLGLKGVVYWWGHIGIAESGRETITHVLVREKAKKTNGK